MILVIGNYRTGSTTLVDELAVAHGYQKPITSGEFCNPYLGKLHDQMGWQRLPEQPPENFVVKVFKDQLINYYKDEWYYYFRKYFIKRTEQIYYSARDDFSKQLNSYLTALESGIWTPDMITYNKELSQYIKPTTITDEIIEASITTLKENLEFQMMCHDLYGGTVIWLEDREQSPYNDKLSYSHNQQTDIQSVKRYWRDWDCV